MPRISSAGPKHLIELKPQVGVHLLNADFDPYLSDGLVQNRLLGLSYADYASSENMHMSLRMGLRFKSKVEQTYYVEGGYCKPFNRHYVQAGDNYLYVLSAGIIVYY